MPASIPPRNKIEKKYTWNAESVFPSNEAWETEVKQILADIPVVKGFQGRLSESPAILLECLHAYENLVARAQIANMYAGFSYSVDTADQKAAGMRGKAQGMFGQVISAVSFLQPELLQVGKSKLDEFVRQEEKLNPYKHSFEDLFRKQAHVRSAEVEEILGMVSEPLAGFYNSTSMLTNADFKFKSIRDSKGKPLDVSQGNYDSQLMGLTDRKARKAAYITYMDKYVEHKNTLASNLAHNIQANVFNMRARRHESTLAASLFDLNIPTDVFHNLINTFRKNLPIWHRYFALRRKALGLKKLAYYDVWAPLPGARQRTVPYGDMKRGDLLFFDLSGKKSSHVAIYLGDGRFVHAPATGRSVDLGSLADPFWKDYFSAARRIDAD